jgi:tryptophan-rich sensory protein
LARDASWVRGVIMRTAPGPSAPAAASRTHRHPAVVLAAFVVVSEAVGLLGAWFSTHGHDWYTGLHQPAFAPPDAVFAPVWTALYAVVAVAAWLVWRHHRTWQRDVALRWWSAQLVLNGLWAPLFFGVRHPVWALADVIALVVVVAITLVRFLPFDRRASALLLPYLGWLLFALALNAAIVARN